MLKKGLTKKQAPIQFANDKLNIIVVEGHNKAASVVGPAELPLDLTLNVALFFRGWDAVVKVYQVPAPKVVSQVVVVEVRHLHIRFNPRQATHVFREGIGLHASGIDPVVEQLLADAVVCIKGGDFLYIPDFGVELDHRIVVPVSHLEHPLVLVNTNLLKGNMLHLSDGPHLVPSHRNRKPVE